MKKIDRIISEQINRLVNEARGEDGRFMGKSENGADDEYVAKHGKKETNTSRGRFTSILKNKAVNLAALADEMNNIDPDGSWDSSRLVKVRDNKPGYSGGHFHVDKDMADTGLEAASNLRLL